MPSAALRAWGLDSNRHGFMTYILCCPQGTWDLLAPEPGPPIVGGDWIFMGTNQADFPESGYGTWGAAVDFCIAQGGDDLCPFDSKIVILSRIACCPSR